MYTAILTHLLLIMNRSTTIDGRVNLRYFGVQRILLVENIYPNPYSYNMDQSEMYGRVDLIY